MTPNYADDVTVIIVSNIREVNQRRLTCRKLGTDTKIPEQQQTSNELKEDNTSQKHGMAEEEKTERRTTNTDSSARDRKKQNHPLKKIHPNPGLQHPTQPDMAVPPTKWGEISPGRPEEETRNTKISQSPDATKMQKNPS